MVVQCDDEVWSMTFGLTPSRPPKQDTENAGRRRASLTKCPDFYNFRAPCNRLVLAVGLRNGRIRLYSVYAARFITELIDHKLPIRQIQFRPFVFLNDNDREKDSMILLSASRDSTLKLWNLYDDCNMFKTLEHHEKGEWVMCCSWAPNGRWAASGGTPSSLFVYDANNWTLFRNLKGHLNVVTACQFSPDSALLASSSFDTTLILWDFQKGVKLRHFWHLLPAPRLIYASGANGFHVRSLSFSPDGEHLASVCDDGFLRTWSIFDAHDTPETVAIGAVSNAMCASFSPDGAFLSVGTRGGGVRFFVSYMRVKHLTEICRGAVRKICHSNDRVQNLPLSKQLKSFLLYEFM
uniref:SOCS box domain-containing protein n=1 Tax=Romanomermis culicivorax TaxID=13658 RepID=A0A915JP94_ROMCU